MISYVKFIYSYFFPDKASDDEKEIFLLDQLSELEVIAQDSNEEDFNEELDPSTLKIPKSAICYERTGVITDIEGFQVLIDGTFIFDTTGCNLNFHVGDQISYLCYKDDRDHIIIVRILKNHGTFWGNEEDAVDENHYNITEHVFVGEVEYREDRSVYIRNGNNTVKFDLDSVVATFVPIQGDWLELLCKVKFDDDKPMDMSFAMIIEVLSFKAVRSKVKSATITSWTGDTGTCDKKIFFDKHCIINGGQPTVGSKVLIEAIESNQCTCTWRVIKMEITESLITNVINSNIIEDVETKSLDVEAKQNIEVTHPLKFENVNFHENPTITLNITNNSEQPIVLNKWIMLCKKRDSQVNISPFLNRPKKIFPRHSFSMTITCYPKFFGQSKEHLIIMFRGFQVERMIEVNVLTSVVSENNMGNDKSQAVFKTQSEKIALMKDIRQDKDVPLRGMQLYRKPNFISVKLGVFPIPDKVWNAVLGDSNETYNHADFTKILARIEMNLPCLIQTLSIHNYTDRFHTLLFIEEIQQTIDMRSYDMPKVFLMKYQEYLGIEVAGLAERRPSLMVGDKVIVKNIWDNSMPSYEGFIHQIKGELVLMKFYTRFHEDYSGSDVALQFHFGRTVYRRAHQAVNLAISNLGVDILFPSRIKTRPLQLSQDTVDSIAWFNKDLNDGQKLAIKKILLGECRPMPYCIYGPPGTGKTMTVIETILQILTLMPDSRILVATPSNSAANLIAERLLLYKKYFSSSIVRIIAHYLVNQDSIPDIIKPYCATINIAREDTVESTHEVKDGMNLNVHASYLARYRVAIATCYSLGAMAQLGLPKGHYTHIIVDEAGQALEPEIMIPLTFLDKENGQIILAGDPMQLGPITLSKYSSEYGYDEPYLARILKTFPYQRDYNAFSNGFNDKLVTRLTENYRSLEEVISLPSEMFYDSSLVAKLDRNMPWIGGMLGIVSELFESTNDHKTGGIFVYGIKGCNTRAEDSPSWFNPQEASMVALTVCKLFKKNVTPDEIGIITPYIAQVKHIRLIFDAMGLPHPKIGTVEEFQGQERPIIIISTVRTSDSHRYVDQKHALGFISNPKRLNVAVTRAQVAVLLFCDPHLLSNDSLWHKVINHAIKNDKYVGCDLPLTFVKKENELNVD